MADFVFQLDGKNTELIKLQRILIQLENKAIHFLEAFLAGVEEPTQRRIFKFAADTNKSSLLKTAKAIHQYRADVEKLRLEKTWLETEIRKCQKMLADEACA
jgi:hypothetical protein